MGAWIRKGKIEKYNFTEMLKRFRSVFKNELIRTNVCTHFVWNPDDYYVGTSYVNLFKMYNDSIYNDLM